MPSYLTADGARELVRLWRKNEAAIQPALDNAYEIIRSNASAGVERAHVGPNRLGVPLMLWQVERIAARLGSEGYRAVVDINGHLDISWE